MVASAVLVEYTRGVNLRMASADVEAAHLFLRQQNVKERRLQRLIKSADMKEVRHQKTTTNKSSSRARHLVVAKFSKVKPTDAFAKKKNESSLLMNN